MECHRDQVAPTATSASPTEQIFHYSSDNLVMSLCSGKREYMEGEEAELSGDETVSDKEEGN